MSNQEQIDTLAIPETVKSNPESVEKIAPQFESVVDKKLAKLADYDLKNSETTLLLNQKAEKAITANDGNPEFLTDLTSKIQEKDKQEKEVIVDGKTRIEEIKNAGSASLDANLFSKKYHHPNYRSEVAKSIVEERKSGKDGTESLAQFQEKTNEEKANLESQEKERDVRSLMEEKGLLFLHAIPLGKRWDTTRGNNPNISHEKYTEAGFDDSYKIIAGLSPTISVSIPSTERNRNGLMQKQGIILGEGKILSAKDNDSGSVAHSLDKRISKYDNEGHEHSAIQPTIDLSKSLLDGAEVKGSIVSNWNELTVEKPKIAGLYYDMSFKPLDPNEAGFLSYSPDPLVRETEANRQNNHAVEIQKKELLEMYRNSKQYKVPLYVFRDEDGELKKYKVGVTQDPDVSERYENDVLVPKMNELLSRVAMESPEYQKFLEEEVRPFKKTKGKFEYDLTSVNERDILGAEKEVSNQERVEMVKGLQSKGIFTGQSEKEVEKKLKELEGNE